jgi:hypothetical protein
MVEVAGSEKLKGERTAFPVICYRTATAPLTHGKKG